MPPVNAVVMSGDNTDRPTTGSFLNQVYISADIGQVSVWNGSTWDEYVMEGGEAGVSDHGALTGLEDDDHTNYQLRSEKGANSGYASLDSSGIVPDDELPADLARDSDVSGAVGAHEAAGDPHPGYRLESADHSHQSTGAQGGKLDHGAALEGLTDDDHTQYLKEKAAGGTAAEVPEHDHTVAAEGGILPHPSLSDFETYERLIIVAHRGDINPTTGYPEETLEGMRQAAIKGVNRVDLDVRLNADGTWWIMHDATVDRTTDGTGTVLSKTDAQMAALVIDGGYGYVSARHSGLLSVPTLEEMIDALLPYDVTFQLDNKVNGDATALAEWVVEHDLVHRALINAYNQQAAQDIKAVDPRITVLGDDAWPESDQIGSAWDDYVQADVFNAAPLQFGIVIPIEDFGSVDEEEIVTDAFNAGIRAIISNDIDVALATKRSLLGSSSGTSQSSGGELVVPFGSDVSGDAYNNTSGFESFDQFGFVTRKVNPDSYDFSPLRIVLEVHLKSSDVGLTAKARLFDVTDGVAVAGSTVITTSTTPVRLRSPYFTLDDAEHEYRIEFGGDDTITATCYDAVIIFGDDSLSAGTDGESEPAETPTVGDDVANEIRNFPSLEKADNAQPQWWEEADGNATLTEVDLAGEGITEKYARALKVVVASANSYAYQEYTYADEPRLKAGKTYSVAVDVWSVSAVAARVRLQSSSGSLGASPDTTAASWTRMEVEGVALNGTTLQLRLEVDVGTAYFVPLGLVEGVEAPTTQLRPRGLRRIQLTPPVSFLTDSTALNGTFQDEDVSSDTSPLAVIIEAEVRQSRTSAGTSHTHIRTNWSSTAVGNQTRVGLYGTVPTNADIYSFYSIMLDDQQIFERTNEGGTVAETHVLHAYHEWE